jgi:nucleotide-binding universal stress UspA family protein
MRSLRTVLVAHDFSPHAEAALDLAIDLARPSKARICLLHIFPLPMEMLSPYEIPMPPALVADVRAAASARLEKALARVREAGLPGEAEVDSGPIAETLVARAAATGADLIVLGTRGLSGVKHLLMGSVAERVLRTAPCPVLTAHAGGPTDGGRG